WLKKWAIPLKKNTFYQLDLYPLHVPMKMINKHLLPIVLAAVLIGCNSRPSKQEGDDTIYTAEPDQEVKLFEEQAYKDSVLLATTEEVLSTIKAKEYSKLAAYFHPREGIRFSPYGY